MVGDEESVGEATVSTDTVAAGEEMVDEGVLMPESGSMSDSRSESRISLSSALKQ